MGRHRVLLKWVLSLSIVAVLPLIDTTAWAAIKVTRAVYRLDSDQLFVIATSDLGDQAALQIEFPNIGSRAMVWKSEKNRWQKALQRASKRGFDLSGLDHVRVWGPEGEATAPIEMVWKGETDSDPHAGLTHEGYPYNCLACHADKAEQVTKTVHYQWMGDTPDMVNGVGQRQGKLTSSVNSYCINIQGDWPVCGSCHVGRGQRPDEAAGRLDNVDCLVCHNSNYATRRTRLPDGTLGVVDPDDSLVRTIHRPSRANCLSCHAKAGGGDGVKRGDLSLATASNTDRGFDVHMNAGGRDLTCQSCHMFKDHKVIGKGSDLRPTDDPARGAEVSCLTCHVDKSTREGHDTEKINDHVARVACQTCHIPLYAKVPTEVHRDWRMHHDGTPADASALPGHPYTEKLADLVPLYRFWNRKSDNALLGDDASRTYNLGLDTWPTSTPLGDVHDAKLYPFKYKTATQPMTSADHRLIALNTWEYLKISGNVNTAIEQGLAAMGYTASTPYEWVTTDTYGMLNHGISPSSDALQCTDCHDRSDRMDLQGELGYQLKEDSSLVCIQCHGPKENINFTKIHDKHVKGKKYDCSNCHTFSRPERGLRMGG